MFSELGDLQSLVMADACEMYFEAMMDQAMNPRNLDTISYAEGFAGVAGPCGDTMEVWLKINDNTITDVYFMTDCCGTSIASGIMMAEFAKDKSFSETTIICL